MKPLRSHLLVLVLLLALPVGSRSQGEPATLIAGVSNVPPASWQHDGRWQGMDIDFYQALAAESGLFFNFRELSRSRGLESITSGECTIMAGMPTTEKMSTSLHFLGPYAYAEMVLVVHKDDLGVPIGNLQQLITQMRARGLQVGIKGNTDYGAEFNLRLEKDPAFRANFAFNDTVMVEMVRNRRLFAFIEQKPLARYRIRNLAEYADLAIHPFTINRAPLSLAVSKSVPQGIVTRLEHAVAALSSNSTFADIESRWMSR
jgi:polar amino acid transport system substrate-binding protein